MEILIKGQEFLVYLLLIMFVTGILKERGYLTDLFRLLTQKIKSKKAVEKEVWYHRLLGNSPLLSMVTT